MCLCVCVCVYMCVYVCARMCICVCVCVCVCAHSVASVMSDSVMPWTVTCQASLSFTISRSLLKLMSIESVMPSSHLILCRPLLFLPLIFPRIRVFSNELALHIRLPKLWGFSISPPMNIQGWFLLRLTGLVSLLRIFSIPQESSPAPQFESISSSMLRRMYVYVYLNHSAIERKLTQPCKSTMCCSVLSHSVMSDSLWEINYISI